MPNGDEPGRGERRGEGRRREPELSKEPPVDRRLMAWARERWGQPQDTEGNPIPGAAGQFGNVMTEKELEEIIKPLQELLPSEEQPKRVAYEKRELPPEQEREVKARDRERLKPPPKRRRETHAEWEARSHEWQARRNETLRMRRESEERERQLTYPTIHPEPRYIPSKEQEKAAEDALFGFPPEPKRDGETDTEFAARQAQHQTELTAWQARREETIDQLLDRGELPPRPRRETEEPIERYNERLLEWQRLALRLAEGKVGEAPRLGPRGERIDEEWLAEQSRQAADYEAWQLRINEARDQFIADGTLAPRPERKRGETDAEWEERSRRWQELTQQLVEQRIGAPPRLEPRRGPTDAEWQTKYTEWQRLRAEALERKRSSELREKSFPYGGRYTAEEGWQNIRQPSKQDLTEAEARLTPPSPPQRKGTTETEQEWEKKQREFYELAEKEAKHIREAEEYLKEGQVAQRVTPIERLSAQSPELRRAFDALEHDYEKKREGLLAHLGHELRHWWWRNGREIFPVSLAELDWWKITKNALAPIAAGTLMYRTFGSYAIGPGVLLGIFYGLTMSAKDALDFIDSVKDRSKRDAERRAKAEPTLTQTVQRQRVSRTGQAGAQSWLGNELMTADWRGLAERIGLYDQTPVLTNGQPAFRWLPEYRRPKKPEEKEEPKPEPKLLTNLGPGQELAPDPSRPGRAVEASIGEETRARLTAEGLEPAAVDRAVELNLRLRRLILAVAKARGTVAHDVPYDQYRRLPPAERTNSTLHYLEQLQNLRYSEADKVDKRLIGRRVVEPRLGSDDPRREILQDYPDHYDLTLIANWLQKNIR